jgi:hypothetical protein
MKLGEGTRHAPILHRMAILEGFYVDSEVRLSSLIVVVFLTFEI